jgi:hypothetical protein
MAIASQPCLPILDHMGTAMATIHPILSLIPLTQAMPILHQRRHIPRMGTVCTDHHHLKAPQEVENEETRSAVERGTERENGTESYATVNSAIGIFETGTDEVITPPAAVCKWMLSLPHMSTIDMA